MAYLSRTSAAVQPFRPRPLVFLIAFLALATGAVVFKFGPMLCLMALAAVVLLLISFAKPEVATLIVLFVLYANLSVVAFRFHNVPEVVASSVFLLLGIPLGAYVIIRRSPLIFDAVFGLMSIYLVLLLASAMFARQPADSLDDIVRYVLEGMALYFLIVNTVRSRKLLRQALWTLLLAGVFMGSLSVYQELTKTYHKSYGGLAQMQATEMKTGDVADNTEETRGRLAGPIGETNRYAQIMVVLLPFGIVLMFLEKHPKMKFAAAACCLPILWAVLLTFSRSAGVALIFLFVLVLACGYVRLRHAVLVGAAGLIFIVIAAPVFLHRFATLTTMTQLQSSSTAVGAESSIRNRATLYLATLRIFADHPLLGVGPGQTRLYIPRYAEDTGFVRIDKTKRAHDMYLETLSDVGIVGFLGFMLVVATILLKLLRVRRELLERDLQYVHIVTALIMAISLYLLTALFLQLSYQRYYWILLALAGAAIHLRPLPPADRRIQVEASAKLL